MNVNFFFRLTLWGVFTGLTACSSFGPVTLFRSSSPHEQYASSLQTAKLDKTALGSDWLAAGNRALSDSLRIPVPHRESGYFAAQKPFAVGYRVNAQRGDKLLIRVEVQGQAQTDVFIDIFELNDRKTTLVASSKADSNVLTWDVKRNQTHLIRIQPELLRSGHYTISVTREPLLSFPVQGRDSRQISSYFGQPRDGGKRRHEGIDIFAPRGTPALASIDGVISGVGESRLGGNVVWLSDAKHDQRLYYAHLDRFNVTNGQRVAVGDTVGFVGNTGNARTTGPHLHFGVYALGEGALDPLAFVRRSTGPARQPILAKTRLNDTVRTTPARAFVRLSPSADAPILSELSRSSPV
ncbi:MAG: M23 family metallopeptidase, partial [Bacteroidetes bacterium]|nr:M23 family metallopeptidase [Fibrella sp.]